MPIKHSATQIFLQTFDLALGHSTKLHSTEDTWLRNSTPEAMAAMVPSRRQPKYRGILPPKWKYGRLENPRFFILHLQMVDVPLLCFIFGENLIKIDDLGGPPLFLKHPSGGFGWFHQ